MSQREVEHLIGRLVTDEDFRRDYLADPRGILRGLVERGTTLSSAEVTALTATDAAVWLRAAHEIDPRLQKASLTDGRTRADDEEAGRR